MNAIIDIKTPAGQSLEGFPAVIDSLEVMIPNVLENIRREFNSLNSLYLYCHELHKGDKITIEIL